MARGWESKSVESQQEESQQKSDRHGPMTPEEAARERERESLRLSRARIRQQLETATDPRYIKLLNDTLQELDARIARMK